MKKISDKPIKILVFCPLKRLIFICRSQQVTAKHFKIAQSSVHAACVGKTVSCNGLYFRHLKDDIEVTVDDLDTLKLEDYDELCGVDRRTYGTKKMSRKGMKYKKQPN